jgi:hypothetical protein
MGGWVVSITPRPHFSSREMTPGTHCTGGWVGLRARLDTEARGKILSPLPQIKPWSPCRPAHSQTLYWLSYPAHKEELQIVINKAVLLIKPMFTCLISISFIKSSICLFKQKTSAAGWLCSSASSFPEERPKHSSQYHTYLWWGDVAGAQSAPEVVGHPVTCVVPMELAAGW